MLPTGPKEESGENNNQKQKIHEKESLTIITTGAYQLADRLWQFPSSRPGSDDQHRVPRVHVLAVIEQDIFQEEIHRCNKVQYGLEY